MGRCRSYFYGRGLIRYRPGKRCERENGHTGPHTAAGSFLDPRESHRWGNRARRCTSVYGRGLTLAGRPIRCELARGHSGQHGHSFAARYWTDGDRPAHATDIYPHDDFAGFTGQKLED